MSTPNKIALVDFGYQTYAIPLESLSATLEQFAALRKVEKRYETGGYVYWYSDEEDRELNATVIAGSRVHDEDPGKTPPAPVPVQPVFSAPADERLIAAPSDAPIAIRSVPPMREFVDEWRHDDAPVAAMETGEQP